MAGWGFAGLGVWDEHGQLQRFLGLQIRDCRCACVVRFGVIGVSAFSRTDTDMLGVDDFLLSWVHQHQSPTPLPFTNPPPSITTQSPPIHTFHTPPPPALSHKPPHPPTPQTHPSSPHSNKHLPPKPKQIPSLPTPSIRRRFALRSHFRARHILRCYSTHIRNRLPERAFAGAVCLRGG